MSFDEVTDWIRGNADRITGILGLLATLVTRLLYEPYVSLTIGLLAVLVLCLLPSLLPWRRKRLLNRIRQLEGEGRSRALEKLLSLPNPGFREILCELDSFEESKLADCAKRARLKPSAAALFGSVLTDPATESEICWKAVRLGRYLHAPRFRIHIRGLYSTAKPERDLEVIEALDAFDNRSDIHLLEWAAREGRCPAVRDKAVAILVQDLEYVSRVLQGGHTDTMTRIVISKCKEEQFAHLNEVIRANWAKMQRQNQLEVLKRLGGIEDLAAEDRPRACEILRQEVEVSPDDPIPLEMLESANTSSALSELNRLSDWAAGRSLDDLLYRVEVSIYNWTERNRTNTC